MCVCVCVWVSRWGWQNNNSREWSLAISLTFKLMRFQQMGGSESERVKPRWLAATETPPRQSPEWHSMRSHLNVIDDTSLPRNPNNNAMQWRNPNWNARRVSFHGMQKIKLPPNTNISESLPPDPSSALFRISHFIVSVPGLVDNNSLLGHPPPLGFSIQPIPFQF